MANHKREFRRDLFEIENARNLTRDELVATFVPTGNFWRLLSAKNNIVLGSRGSGKTALAKMLSHDHLSRLDDERARQAIISKEFIGIYLPTSIEWVGGLKNKPWQSEGEAETFFQWRLNISTCLAFLIALRSCLGMYYQDKGRRARLEADLVSELSLSWSDGERKCETIRTLQNYLEDLEHSKQQELLRGRAMRSGGPERPIGLSFEGELFGPLRRGMALTERALECPEECTWLLCLDEAEFLQPMHHRILNSHLRVHSGNLAFKITTMPYFHHTLDTNIGVPLSVGHDFEYVYIDHDPVFLARRESEEGQQFAETLFNKRAEVSGSKYSGLKLRQMLGRSELLDQKKSQWGPESRKMVLLRKHASAKTLGRAELLAGSRAAFMDQIARKLHGALLLREAVRWHKGRRELDVYSGDSMVIRCGDANPRRLIRIFNSLLLEVKWRPRVYRLAGKAQTRILVGFSKSTLVRVQSEPECGPELYEFIQAIGSYMHFSLHRRPLTTDQVSSVVVDRSITDDNWKLVERAVGLALLFPNVNPNNPDQMPDRRGAFHLAYVLAPHFRLLPRRGKARSLTAILAHRPKGKPSEAPGQPSLFKLDEEDDA